MSAIGWPWLIEKPYTAERIPLRMQIGKPLAKENDVSVLFFKRSFSLNLPATPHKIIPSTPIPIPYINHGAPFFWRTALNSPLIKGGNKVPSTHEMPTE